MNRTRPKQIVIRMSEEEYNQVKTNVALSGMRQQEYLIKAVTNQTITNMDGVKEIVPELKRVGNNLNQLAKKANEGKGVPLAEVEQMKKELDEIWQLLRRCIAERA